MKWVPVGENKTKQKNKCPIESKEVVVVVVRFLAQMGGERIRFTFALGCA